MKTFFDGGGDLRDLDPLAALVTAWRTSSAGALRFERAGASAGFDLLSGELVGVYSSDPRFETSAILVRAGKLAADAVDRLSVPEGGDATAAAVQAGILTRREWKWGEKIRAIEVLSDLLTWSDGRYEFDSAAIREAGEFRLPIPRLLLELFLRSRDRHLVEHQLGPSDVPLRRAGSFEEDFGTFGLTADAESVVRLIDGRSTAREISQQAPADEFAVSKLLAALVTLGLVQPVAQSEQEREAAPASAADSGEPESAEERPSAAEPPLEGKEFPAEEDFPPQEPPSNEFDELERAGPDPDLLMERVERDESRGPASLDPGGAAWDDLAVRDPVALPAEEPPMRRVPVAILALGLVGLIAIATALLLTRDGTTRWEARSSPGTPVPALTFPPPATAVPASASRPAAALSPAPVPSPVARPAVDPARSTGGSLPSEARSEWNRRAERDRRRLAGDRSTRYAIQLALLCETPSLTQAWRHDRGSAMWLLASDHQGRKCFRVLWGRYPTLEAARRAKPGVPSFFSTPTNRPAVVAVR